MDTDFDLKEAISLTQAAKMLRGRAGRARCLATLRRWANSRRGWRPHGGAQQVLLQVVKLNGELLTMESWVTEFRDAQVAAARRELPPGLRTSRQREAAHRRAEEYLDRGGI
jgi:hypothetical protein